MTELDVAFRSFSKAPAAFSYQLRTACMRRHSDVVFHTEQNCVSAKFNGR